MARFIMKASPTDDLYCEWSSIVEAPTWIGTRSELIAYLSEHRFEGDRCQAHAPEEAEARIARVDQTGTSVRFRIGPHIEGSWDDEGIIYQQQGMLPRSRLTAFLRRFIGASDGEPEWCEDPDVSDLLDPFEDA